MDYSKHYNSIITNAQHRNWSKKNAPCYVEKHHITPRCLGGDNTINNLVCLTAKEHYVAHLLLAKIYNTKELLWAVISFRSSNGNTRFTGSMYESFRIKQSKLTSGRNNINYGKSTWNKGLQFSEESKRKMSNSHLKQRESKIVCPHCGKSVDGANFSKWHGDNCKLSPNYVAPQKKKRKSPIKQTEPRNLRLFTCPHCGLQGKGGNMRRWHFDNCRYKNCSIEFKNASSSCSSK